MKNQYFGDVGDYGKYGMLRFFADNDIRIAVNWYLTPDNGDREKEPVNAKSSIKYWLLEQGCELVIKEAKNGYTATYKLEKKTAMNWVFRKSGILSRIYGDNVYKYEDMIVSLPEVMQKKMTASRDCKGLIDPDSCSPYCVQGFVYALNGETHQKCRNDGMFYLLTNETAEYIDRLVCKEVSVRKSVS